MEYGLIGEKLPHSFSKEIHRRIAPYVYELVELPPDSLEAFMTQRDFKGINVTIPYKREVMKYLDVTDADAEEIGAVNTVVKRDGRLYGYNTDLFGLSSLIERVAGSLDGRDVLILGTGGTSHTARVACRRLGAASVTVAGRTAREDAISYETAYESCREVQVIINTTPCGMFPNADGGDGIPESAVDISRFPRLEAVVDAVYNPLRTSLVLDSAAAGARSEGGLYMLVAQAVRASELFTGDVRDSSLTERIFREVSLEKENIVLTGMPGSGKSTVGRELARRMGRTFVDTDELVREAEGKEISDIFAERGEEYFRDAESAALRRAAALSGAVIATGGGAVLREQNVRALRRNGRIFFLDRPLEDIIPTCDRPTASDREALSRRFAERKGIYRSSCDVRVEVRHGVEAVAEQIISSFNSECDL